MTRNEPLKQILAETREHWDHSGVRQTVRDNFHRVLACRTPTLGAEIYRSAHEEKVVFHTCKSRSCPVCGQWAMERWQQEMYNTLPDISYVGMVFTMPDVLWTIFQQHRNLLHDLPVLGAEVLQQWAKRQCGAQLIVMVVPHTFGRHLNFNSHLHILVSRGGLSKTDGQWITNLEFHRNALMRMWRFAVITYLREVFKAMSGSSDIHLREELRKQYERWWNIRMDRSMPKSHFLKYACRYVRHPPIAQRRIVEIKDGKVTFWTKDLKLKQRVTTQCTLVEFVTRLFPHVKDEYEHAIRYFGLLAPRKRRDLSAVFLIIGQKQRSLPRRLRWSEYVRMTFGIDPLMDSKDQPFCWSGHIPPIR
jgi:hypothetical protein